MFNSNNLFIVDVSGPEGAQNVMKEWCDQVAKTLSGLPGLDRIGRYQRLNDIRTLMVVEANAPVESLSATFMQPPSPLAVATVAARQLSEYKRADANGDPRDCPLLYAAAFPVPAEDEDMIGEWYDVEHTPILLRCPHWIMTRRFRIENSPNDRWGRHLAFHYLSDIRALRSPERAEARQTPWNNRMVAEPWYRGGRFSVCLQDA